MGIDRTRSRTLFRRAQQIMPGGVNSPARAFGAVGGEPIVIARAEGAYLYDVDGNRYIDFIGSWGPMILGHCHPRVQQAVIEAVGRGTSYGAPTESENILAELIIEAVPSLEKVRLVNSGTEATMSAIRLARGFTQRDIVIKFAGNYHGHVDSLLVAAGSSAATLAVPDSPGVTDGTARDTLILEYNDPSALAAAFAEHGERIACVIVEPVAGNMGCVSPTSEFLGQLRKLTTVNGSLLIFDEVMTGFRVSYGGAQALWGVQPDLTTLGKIVGGGLPIGVYGGRAEVMDYVLPAGKVFQAGTLSGNPIATAAGIATLETLRDDPPYQRLEQNGARLESELGQAAEKAGIPHSVSRVGSMLTLFFNVEPIVGWQQASCCDTARFGRFFWGMLDRGIYLPCSQFEVIFLSAAHSDEDLDATINAAQETLRDVAIADN